MSCAVLCRVLWAVFDAGRYATPIAVALPAVMRLLMQNTDPLTTLFNHYCVCYRNMPCVCIMWMGMRLYPVYGHRCVSQQPGPA